MRRALRADAPSPGSRSAGAATSAISKSPPGATMTPSKPSSAWIRTLALPFHVRLHWLPVNASWLDQIEIVFGELQRKVLTPNDVRVQNPVPFETEVIGRPTS